MAFADDHQPVSRPPEDEVDDASCRGNEDLWLGSPLWANVSGERLDHGGLEAIVEPRASNRKQPDTEFGADARRDCDENLDAWVSPTGFDAPLVSWVDPGASSELRDGHAGIYPQVRYLAADPRPELANVSSPISRATRLRHDRQSRRRGLRAAYRQIPVLSAPIRDCETRFGAIRDSFGRIPAKP